MYEIVMDFYDTFAIVFHYSVFDKYFCTTTYVYLTSPTVLIEPYIVYASIKKILMVGDINIDGLYSTVQTKHPLFREQGTNWSLGTHL